MIIVLIVIAILITFSIAGYFTFFKCNSSQIKGFDNNRKSVCLNKDDFCYNKDTGLKYGIVLKDSDDNLKCFKNNDSCGFNKKIINYSCVYVDPIPKRSTRQSILIKSINENSLKSNKNSLKSNKNSTNPLSVSNQKLQDDKNKHQLEIEKEKEKQIVESKARLDEAKKDEARRNSELLKESTERDSKISKEQQDLEKKQNVQFDNIFKEQQKHMNAELEAQKLVADGNLSSALEESSQIANKQSERLTSLGLF